MTLALLTIPDDIDHLGQWLEAHLVGGDLRRVATELAAIHQAAPPTASIRDRLGAALPEILARGLSVLPAAELRHLLRQPYHLLELQEIVLIEGGPYWDSVSRPPAVADLTRTARESIQQAVFAQYAEPIDSSKPAASRRIWRSRTLWAVAATAAIVFIATFAATMYLTPQPNQVEVAWGWAKPNAFPADLSRGAYLNRLAEEADEWFNKRPQTIDEAARRLTELRRGCTALLLTPNPQLTPADRVWLRELCRKWRERVDKQLIVLEDDRNTAAVLKTTDAIVREMVKDLRDRAASA